MPRRPRKRKIGAAGRAPSQARQGLARILQLLAALLLAAALIGQAGRWIAPIDGFNQFAHLRLLAALACGLLLLALSPRAKAALAMIALAITVDASLLAPELAPRRAAPAGAVPALRLVQFNLLKQNTDPAAAADWILAQDADLVALEEAHGAASMVVERLRPHYPFVADCLGQARRCSTMLLSRQRPVAWGPLAHGDPENRGALSALWARYAAPGGGYTVVVAHLNRPRPFGSGGRDRATLQRFLASQPTDDLVMAGDFNLAPWSFAFHDLTAGVGLTRLTPALPTWPSDPERNGPPNLRLLPLDHVVAGRNWSLASAQLGPRLGSDHRPWVVTLARRAQPKIGWSGRRLRFGDADEAARVTASARKALRGMAHAG